MRVVLVSNPTSTRNRARGMAGIEAVAAERPNLVHLVFPGGPGLDAIAREIARAKAGLVVANSGDGTFQGLLTEILARPDLFPKPPLLSHMARGGANMTALDCGLKRGRAEDLRRLLDLADRDALEPHLVERSVLKLDYAKGKRPERGLFLGFAGIVDGIALCKREVNARGLQGVFSHTLTLIGLLLAAAARGPAAAGIGPHHVTVARDGARPAPRLLLLGLVTTLKRLMLGSRPFWGGGSGPMRYTEIAPDAPGLLRHARSVLFGGDARVLPEGYRSCRADRLELGLDGPLALDGELFHPAADRPVVVTAAERLRFVRL